MSRLHKSQRRTLSFETTQETTFEKQKALLSKASIAIWTSILGRHCLPNVDTSTPSEGPNWPLSNPTIEQQEDLWQCRLRFVTICVELIVRCCRLRTLYLKDVVGYEFRHVHQSKRILLESDSPRFQKRRPWMDVRKNHKWLCIHVGFLKQAYPFDCHDECARFFFNLVFFK